jgi:AraC-like DNA-binding protein
VYARAVQRAGTSEAFFSAPAKSYLAREGLLYWCYDRSLWGITMWGTIDDAVATQLARWIDEEHARPHESYVTAIDLRRVSGVDPEAFSAWQQWYTSTRERQRVRVQRAAIVRPLSGIPAMLVAGIPAVLGPSIPWTVTDSLEDALASITVPEPSTVAAALDAAFEDAQRDSALALIRAALDEHPSASIDEIAARVGLSRRSLQRALQQSRTTFVHESQSARVRCAQRLLAHGNAKLAAVALEAGFANQGQFSTVFRKVVGETPSSWLARHLRANASPRSPGQR